MNSVIEVEGLVKKYKDGKEAIKGIEINVERRKIFGLLGPNGTGKTTTLSILTTMIRKTAGKAFVGGIAVDENPDKVRKKIGIVFQGATSDVQMTGRENHRAARFSGRGYSSICKDVQTHN